MNLRDEKVTDMKRILLLGTALCLLVLSACGGTTSSSQPVSSSAPSMAASSVSMPAQSSSAPASVSGPGALDGTLATLSEAAALGDAIAVSEIDLKANGLDTANVVAFAGAESRMSSENGGIVMVFQMQPGTTADMVTALGAYRDARAGDDRYAEFATARENTAGARIVEKGDLVIYAVSATGQDGGYDALDAAIAAIA